MKNFRLYVDGLCNVTVLCGRRSFSRVYVGSCVRQQPTNFLEQITQIMDENFCAVITGTTVESEPIDGTFDKFHQLPIRISMLAILNTRSTYRYLFAFVELLVQCTMYIRTLW